MHLPSCAPFLLLEWERPSIRSAAAVNLLPREPRVGLVFLACGGHSVRSSVGDQPGSSWVSGVPWVFMCPHLGPGNHLLLEQLPTPRNGLAAPLGPGAHWVWT